MNKFEGAPPDPLVASRMLAEATLSEKLLDFVVVGASKSGTTSLFQYLRTHPEIAIPASKDAPFFWAADRSLSAWASFADKQFVHFEPAQRWGTVTPRYMEHSQIPARIEGLMPDVRLVAILRNPIDRAFSQYRQQVRRGKEDRTFAAVVAEQANADHANRVRDMDPPELLTEETYLVRGEYARILAGFTNAFQADQLQIEFTEELDRAPAAPLARVFAHIGVDETFVPPNLGHRYHEGGDKERFPWLVPVTQRLGPVRSLWRRIPLAKRQAAWRWFFTTANVKAEAAPKIDPATRHELVQFFRPDVDKLETLTGRRPPWPEFAT